MREDTRNAIKGLSAKARREYLVDHGLCPVCGDEAAPWYLCWNHRQVNSIRRICNKFAERGVVIKSKDGSGNLYKAAPDMEAKYAQYRWAKYDFGNMPESDKRLRPRLNRRPVDLDETLLQIFRDSDRPLSEEEVIVAWGKLRSKRKTGTLAGDMTKLIRAQRRREARNAKRARVGGLETNEGG